MTRRSWMFFGLIMASAVPAACGILDPTGGSEVTQFSLSIDLDPDEIGPGDTTYVRADLVNEGYRHSSLTVDGDCLGRLKVLRDEQEQAFQITPNPCWQAGNPVSLDAGDTLRIEWEVVAATEGDQPVPVGDYLVYLTVNARLERGSKLNDIAWPLMVK